VILELRSGNLQDLNCYQKGFYFRDHAVNKLSTGYPGVETFPFRNAEELSAKLCPCCLEIDNRGIEGNGTALGCLYPQAMNPRSSCECLGESLVSHRKAHVQKRGLLTGTAKFAKVLINFQWLCWQAWSMLIIWCPWSGEKCIVSAILPFLYDDAELILNSTISGARAEDLNLGFWCRVRCHPG